MAFVFNMQVRSAIITWNLPDLRTFSQNYEASTVKETYEAGICSISSFAISNLFSLWRWVCRYYLSRFIFLLWCDFKFMSIQLDLNTSTKVFTLNVMNKRIVHTIPLNLTDPHRVGMLLRIPESIGVFLLKFISEKTRPVSDVLKKCIAFRFFFALLFSRRIRCVSGSTRCAGVSHTVRWSGWFLVLPPEEIARVSLRTLCAVTKAFRCTFFFTVT